MLKTRIITAVALVAALLPALFLSSNIVWAAITLVVTLLALYEWARLIDLSEAAAGIYTLIYSVFGAVVLYLMNSNGFHWLIYQAILSFMVALIFWLVVVPVLLTKLVVIKRRWLLLLIGFLLMTPLWLALISAKGADPLLLLALLATIWIADSAAYFTGKQFGKNKLAPNISPGKTWEGVFGALVVVSICGGIIYANNLASITIFPLLWLVVMLGVIGDLFESLIKRQVNKKDSGHILPGHGGILDRIDSLVPSLPIAVLMIYLFNYYQMAS